MKRILLAVSAIAVAAAAVPASAANYVFDVTYNGGSSATLAAGSTNPLTTVLRAGDSFTYTLSAFGNSFWNSNAGGEAQFLLALGGNFGSGNTSYRIDLLNDGVSRFNTSGTEGSCCAHLGPYATVLGSNLIFDQARISATITSLERPSAANSLLPIFGAPGQSFGSTFVSFTPLAATAAVPEPATWAMMMLGFGGMGYAMRRRRKDQVRIRFA